LWLEERFTLDAFQTPSCAKEHFYRRGDRNERKHLLLCRRGYNVRHFFSGRRGERRKGKRRTKFMARKSKSKS